VKPPTCRSLAPSSDGHPLQVRWLEVVSGREEALALASVHCPVRASSAPVEDCAQCGQSAGFARDALSGGRHLTSRCAAPRRIRPDEGTPRVNDAMPRSAVALRASLSCADAADALRLRRVQAATVVDGRGRAVGIVGEGELLRARRAEKVGDVMGRVVLSVPESAPLARAAALMAAQRAERVAVVGADGAVVGALTALDVVAWLAAREGALAPLAGPPGQPA
jgi:CBS domain-containing protein